jgi:hypothetical protein
MARPKKDGRFINYFIDRDIYDRLKRYAEEKGQSMTTAIERILDRHLKAYETDRQTLSTEDRYCERCNLLTNLENCPNCGSRQLRVPMVGDCCFLTEKELIWSVNGKETFRYPKTDCGDPDQWPFDKPFYFLLDMQLGGKWVGNVDVATLPVRMYIDWIRVYRRRK